MKLSQSSFLYLNYPLDEAIKRFARMGYAGIEIWGGRPHAYCKDVTKKRAQDLKRLVEKSGMEISGFIPAQFRYPTSLCSPVESIRAESVDYLKNSIHTAVTMDCRKVSICPGHTLFGQSYDQGMDQLTSSLRELSDYACQYNVLLLIEPAHRFESDLIITVADGIRLIKKLESENLGIALDTGHCHVNKESLYDNILLLQHNGIPFHIHLDDNNGVSDQHKIPGEGTINFTPLLMALLESGYEGFLTVELGFDYTKDPDAAALQTIKYLRALLEETRSESLTVKTDHT